MATTTKTLTSEQAAQVASYVKQGIDEATAIRVATAKSRKPAARPGTLHNANKEFSLFR